MKRNRVVVLINILLLAVGVFVTSAQSELAATLEVLNAGVEVQRANTSNPIAVNLEAIVGVGDIIRTDDTGQARVTFFADGTDVTIEPNSEYQIVRFEGGDDDFNLTVEIIVGEATHRLNRTLGSESSYDVETPGMTLAARGTVFAIRVENDGQSGMLVREGLVDATANGDSADVPQEFGIRSEEGEDLSDVVRASSFDELNAALDGCTAIITTDDDVSLNVRLGPSRDTARVGTIAAEDIDIIYGTNTSGNWYRILFREGFGWVLASTIDIDSTCAGLRLFEDTQIEDPSLYNELGETIEVDALIVPETTPEASGE